jgi:hypothetical protein
MKGRTTVLMGLAVVVVALVGSDRGTNRSFLSAAIVHAQSRAQDASAQDDGSETGAAATTAYSNASMKGTYGFATSDYGASSFIGTYTADGRGHITTGTIRVSSSWVARNPACTLSISPGTYNVESNGSGKMTLNVNPPDASCGLDYIDFCAHGTYLIQVAQQGSAVAAAGDCNPCQFVEVSGGVNFFAFNSFRE